MVAGLNEATKAYEEIEYLYDDSFSSPAERAQAFLEADQTQDHHVGTPSLEDMAALIFTIEAARAINSTDYDAAVELLRKAADRVEKRARSGNEKIGF